MNDVNPDKELRKNKNPLIQALKGAVMFLVIICFTKYFGNWFYAKKQAIFDAANINGHLSHIDSHRGGISFTVDNDSTEYFTVGRANETLNNNTFLYQTAKVGDSIVKKSNRDTIYLFKKDGVYKYVVEK